MKAQCERCKEIVALDFTVGEGGIQVRCPSCEASYFVPQVATSAASSVPAPAPMPASAPASVPSTVITAAAVHAFHCPKCGDPQPEGTNCRRCGLVYAKWKGHESSSAAASLPSVAEARAAGELFTACEAHWDEAERHDRFLAFCQQTGALGYAAARYRGAQVTRPNDPIVTARLERIRTLAEATLRRGAPAVGVSGARPAVPYGRLKLVMLGIVVLLAVGTVWAAFFRPPEPADEDKGGVAPTRPVIPTTKAPPTKP